MNLSHTNFKKSFLHFTKALNFRNSFLETIILIFQLLHKNEKKISVKPCFSKTCIILIVGFIFRNMYYIDCRVYFPKHVLY